MIAYTQKQGQYLAFISQIHQNLMECRQRKLIFRHTLETTPPSVHQMVVKLTDQGLIGQIPHTPRSIKILVPPNQIPGLGEDVSGSVNLSGENWSEASYLKAYRFAAEAHQGQLFPGTDLPYLLHISFVSMEIIACLGVEQNHDGDLAIQCALLHDVLEDTEITYSEIEKAFGSQVAQGVLALTKKEFFTQSTGHAR